MVISIFFSKFCLLLLLSVPMKLYFQVSFLSHLQNLDGNLIFSSNLKLKPQSSIPITKYQIPLDQPFLN